MLNRLDKLAPYLTMALFGYLAYAGTVGETGPSQQTGKAPTIGKSLLEVKLMEPGSGTSPVGRDPFEVSWSSYLPSPEPVKVTPKEPATRPAVQPTTVPTTCEAVLTLPALPKRFTAVITTEHYQMAIIDDAIYKPGSLIGGSDPTRCWQVEAITRQRVTLRFGEFRRLLAISEEAPSPAEPPMRGGGP